jgi:tetratricopeptide (TPR) repeat protein
MFDKSGPTQTVTDNSGAVLQIQGNGNVIANTLIIQNISANTSVPIETLCAILESMGEQELAQKSVDEIEALLKTKAQHYLDLQKDLRQLGSEDPEVQALREKAAQALSNGQFQQVREYLSAARKLDVEAFGQQESAARQRRISAAQSTAAQAAAEKLQINPASYRAAATLYTQAAGYVDPVDADLGREYRERQARVLYELGKDFGDNGALQEAIDLWCRLVSETDRTQDAESWARLQNNLGTALETLGERESGTARLEEAVTAYRAALEEHTRERVPLDWAITQNNLGNALQTLGERESGTARLEEAVTAYRAALEERTRERVPLNWAMTQNNLGTALQTLGERESGTVRLEEAVTAYRAALEVFEASSASHYVGVARKNLARAEALLAQRKG